MRTGFDHESTTTDVLAGIDLSGRRFVITGTSAGLGEEATRSIAAAGGSVVMLARDPAANADAMDRVRASVPEASLSLGQLRLMS
jgi:NAD(P)-dependent dehydrogenase (short-subunit alcohol dehydrogenase family)